MKRGDTIISRRTHGVFGTRWTDKPFEPRSGLFSDTEVAEDVVENVVVTGFAEHAAQFVQCFSQADGRDFIAQTAIRRFNG
jgi:hypothetical protein